MSPEAPGPAPDQSAAPSLEQSQQAHLQQVAANIRAVASVGPSFEQSLQDARALAAVPSSPETGTAIESLSDRDKALIYEAVAIATGAEADFEHHSGHLPAWLKTAAKSASIGAIGSVAIGVGESYAHSKGWHLLPADNSLGEAWFMLVNAYYTSRAWAGRHTSNLKSKMGHS